MMKFVLTLLATLILSITNTIIGQNKTVTVVVENLASDKGKVRFVLYDKKDFKKTPLVVKSTKIINKKSQVIFKNIKAGTYVILCYHDKKEMINFTSEGMSLENDSTSNNRILQDLPTYEDVRFRMKNENVSLKIKF